MGTGIKTATYPVEEVEKTLFPPPMGEPAYDAPACAGCSIEGQDIGGGGSVRP
jgi:hypothetical protein